MDKNYNYLSLPLKFVTAVWLVFFVDLLFINTSFRQYGILPRNVKGSVGILLSPFIHANFLHIISNTGPLFLLLFTTSVLFKYNTLYITFLTILISGVLLWLVGRNSYHIGASGLIYGLTGFLIFYGIFGRKFWPLIISILVSLTYGLSTVIGLLPIFPGVSWEGHLCGLIAGIIVAYFFAK